MDQPDQKMGQDDAYDQQPAKKTKREDEPSTRQRNYVKKAIIYVTDPSVKDALKFFAANVDTYQCVPFQGIIFNDVAYAHYYGRVNNKGEIKMLRTVVLSSDIKVYKLDINGEHTEMSWQTDPEFTGKRPYGHIYLGGEGKGHETILKPVFLTELGIYI